MEKQKLIRKVQNGKESGFTLLEYVAGATVIITVVFVGFNAMGKNLGEFFAGVGTWVTSFTPGTAKS